MHKLLLVLILIFSIGCFNKSQQKDNISLGFLEKLVKCESIEEIDFLIREKDFSFREKSKEDGEDKYVYIKNIHIDSKKYETLLVFTGFANEGLGISYFFSSLAIPSQINFTRKQLNELGYKKRESGCVNANENTLAFCYDKAEFILIIEDTPIKRDGVKNQNLQEIRIMRPHKKESSR